MKLTFRGNCREKISSEIDKQMKMSSSEKVVEMKTGLTLL